MRLMKRNQTAIYYCLYKGKEPLLDEDGNETKRIDDVFLDNLAEVIDLNVENNKVDDYNAKVMDFLMLS